MRDHPQYLVSITSYSSSTSNSYNTTLSGSRAVDSYLEDTKGQSELEIKTDLCVIILSTCSGSPATLIAAGTSASVFTSTAYRSV